MDPVADKRTSPLLEFIVADGSSNFKVLTIKCDVPGSFGNYYQGSPQRGLLVDSHPPSPPICEQEGDLHQSAWFLPLPYGKGETQFGPLKKYFFPHSPLIPYAPGNSLKM